MIVLSKFTWFRLVALSFALAVAAAEPVKVGDAAPDFTLNTLGGTAVKLSAEYARQPVVLVLLRGWPGYQCPLCTRQVHDLVTNADRFTGKARVILIYPGPAEALQAHAQEFLQDKKWPEAFLFLTDPEYTFTSAYGLRWAAPGETAYPSTLVVDRQGKIRFAKISRDHGGRASAAEVAQAVEVLK